MNNRVLKFRVWDKTIKQYRKDDVFMVDINGYLWFTEDYGDGEGQLRVDLAKKDIFIIQQFTGLLDKKGKEIYEGDIVKIDSRIGVVEYSLYLNLCEYRLFLIEDFNNKGDWCRGTFEFDDSIRMKVIGNIFENPEFLNK